MTGSSSALDAAARRDALVERLLHAAVAGTGTVMRAGTVRRYAEQAGFGGFDVLPIEDDFDRFYRLVP